MRPEHLYDLLHKRPFEPFRISLTDGRVFDIRYPKINMVGVSYIIVGIPIPNDPDPIADHSIKIPPIAHPRRRTINRDVSRCHRLT